jgi:catechol 2,3-dioxygenase-like lactoylglutathione lyase family enzyme
VSAQPLGRPDQIGVVVRDLDAAADGMHRVFGLEPHTRTENIYCRTTYPDREIDATVGVMLYDLHGIELEFLAPTPPATSGKTSSTRAARACTTSHIRFAIDDHAAVHENLHAQRLDTYQEGESMRSGGVRYAYYDSVPFLGFLIETLDPEGAA